MFHPPQVGLATITVLLAGRHRVGRSPHTVQARRTLLFLKAGGEASAKTVGSGAIGKGSLGGVVGHGARARPT